MFLLRAHRPERYRERNDVRVDLRRKAERLAERLGIPTDEVRARLEQLAREHE
jgi:predicted ArsR family transcriptional regulator